MAPLLQVKDLTTRFKIEDGVVTAVDGVSFEVGKGEVIGLVGESGCGKSVTALSIMRLISPPGFIAGGSIQYDGKDLLAMPEKQMRKIRGNEIAMIFQEPMTSLNPVFTVGYQIAEALMLHQNLSKKAAYARAAEMLDLVSIPDATKRLHDYPHQMSGGMRQRVMIAMALSCNPSLLIADEPTTALDVTIQAQFLDLLRRLQSELNLAVILITHDLGVVAEFCHRVYVMYTGHVVEEAAVGELYANPKHPYTEGLLASVPHIGDKEKKRLSTIEGMVPSLLELPSGCTFWPRCEHAKAICKGEIPHFRDANPGHHVACTLF